ncbi:hypothetical protein [Actinoallomurus bryophytorum]
MRRVAERLGYGYDLTRGVLGRHVTLRSRTGAPPARPP